MCIDIYIIKTKIAFKLVNKKKIISIEKQQTNQSYKLKNV